LLSIDIFTRVHCPMTKPSPFVCITPEVLKNPHKRWLKMLWWSCDWLSKPTVDVNLLSRIDPFILNVFSFEPLFISGSGAHPASYTLGTRVSFPGGKVARAWSWPLLHLVPRSRMHGAILPLLQYTFMVWCPVKKKHRDNFKLNFLSCVYSITSSKHYIGSSVKWVMSMRIVLQLGIVTVYACMKRRKQNLAS
jgi:hypothetical protein